MLEAVVGKVKKRLDVEGIDDPALDENQARVKQILRDDLAKDVRTKVKRLIRRYFEDLWRQETGQKAAKRAEAAQVEGADDVERKGSDEPGENQKEDGKTEYPAVETGLGQTLEGEEPVPEKRLGESNIASRAVTSSRMTAALDEAKSETISKRSSLQEPVFDGKNKYLLLDAEYGSSPAIVKGTAEADAGLSTGR